MCGIFGLLNYDSSSGGILDIIDTYFMIGSKRGPEYSQLKHVNESLILGFHRLAINGLNPESHQPFDIMNITSITNGEIYNHSKLSRDHGFNLETQSDCEIITPCIN